MAYKRNDEALKEALESHTVDGTEVVVPVFNEAVILDQGGTGPVKHIHPSSVELGSPLVYYQVRAKNPVPFELWLKSRFPQDAAKQLTFDEWARRAGRRGDRPEGEVYLPMPDYMRRKIEEGGTVSPADVEYDDLVNRGCIDQHGKVSCYTFWQDKVLIDPKQLKRGMLVEYEYGRGQEQQRFQGSIIGFSKDGQIALLELFTPVPYLDLPDSVSSGDIKKGFYSDVTYVIGYGTFEAFEIAAEESGENVENLIPPGTWDTEVVKDRRFYTMKEYLPMSVVDELCKEAYGSERWCFWQAMVVYVCPVMLFDETYKGTWHPLPENQVQVDAVISYEEEGEE